MGTRIRAGLRRHRILCIVSIGSQALALLGWSLVSVSPIPLTPVLSIGILAFCLFLTSILLFVRFFLFPPVWVKFWLTISPFLLGSLALLPSLSRVTELWIIPFLWLFFALWGYYRFFPLTQDHRLHKARFARRDEVASYYSDTPAGTSLLIGVHPVTNRFVLVRPRHNRRELGNMLIVGRTRGGKGLRITSQLLSWEHSAVVNDIKGENFKATAGYRATFGKVFVIDPTGVGHRYDPLLSKKTESKLYAAATRLLFKPHEKDPIFTKRAINMLTQLFLASRCEGQPPLPYVRHMIRAGLFETASRLNSLSPELARQLLSAPFEQADFTNRFLVNSWESLVADMIPFLTDEVVRCFTASDFSAKDLLCGEKPVTIYFRWAEEDLVALSPLVRLIWGSLLDELIMTYDRLDGKGCKPVLLEIDEAGRAPIPSLAEHATTVVGRGISIEMSIQSLAQLRVAYGEAGAQTILDNMDTQIYYRHRDITTAEYISRSIGRKSGYAHSETEREGQELSQGLAEQGVPLMTAQEIMQMRDEKIICFHAHLPPFLLRRVDWREQPILIKRYGKTPPTLQTLPPAPELPARQERDASALSSWYTDPDEILQNGRKKPNGITHKGGITARREVDKIYET